jgi:hypothetical protein
MENTMKWVMCETCKWNSKYIGSYFCSNCSLRNKESYVSYWMNEKINDAIRDICIKNGWGEFDNEQMYKEILKLNIL